MTAAIEMIDAGRGMSWRDRYRAFCDRLLGSARFQHWATAFPLTRPIARRRTRALFDLCAGFVYSQILLACIRLNLFEILSEGPLDAAALSVRLSLPVEACERLLRAAAALGLVSRRSRGRFGLGPLGAVLVGNRGLAGLIEHHSLLYADLADPVALLRGEIAEHALQNYWAYARAGRPSGLASDQTAAYTALMSASQAMIAREVLDCYPIGRHRCLLDVGGGDGAFLEAAGQASATLKLIAFDLPSVAARASVRFAQTGLSSRAVAIGGDFLADPLPEGADLVSLVRVLHDHDDPAVLAILRAVRKVLPHDGTLLIAEPMSGTRSGEPIGDAYFGFYLLAMGSGRPRRPDELEALLNQAGFGRVKPIPTRNRLLTGLLTAQPGV
jgi:demethylspheroidene O-methyltransferase